MDLICCCNLLIYHESVLQGKVISVFHYALRPSGFLVLGSSEGLGATTGLFAVEDRTHKIFSKKAVATRPETAFSLNSQAEHRDYGAAVRIPGKQLDANWNYAEAQKE